MHYFMYCNFMSVIFSAPSCACGERSNGPTSSTRRQWSVKEATNNAVVSTNGRAWAAWAAWAK